MSSPAQNDRFPITRHSVVVAMRSDDPVQRSRAIETICAAYWKPIYKYARLKWDLSGEDAQDFTQEFLLRLIDKGFLESFDPGKGRLRTFLRTCADCLFLNQRRDAQRQKRNGGKVCFDFDDAEQEFAKLATSITPEDYFEKECVRQLLAVAIERLREKCELSGKTAHFTVFYDHDLDSDAEAAPSYAELATKYNLAISDVTNYLAWARREFRACVLHQLRQMSASDEEFRSEARAILGTKAL